MAHPFPRVCLITIVAAIAFAGGALAAAWVTSALNGEASSVAAFWTGLAAATATVGLSLWCFSSTGWLGD